MLTRYRKLRSRFDAMNTNTFFLMVVGVLILFVLAFHLEILTHYPTVFIDESWNANAAWNWLQTGVNFDPIHAGTLDQVGYEWLRRSNLGTLPWVFAFKVAGLGLFQARLVSYIFGILLLVAVVLVGYKSHKIATGFLAALFVALSMPFLISAHYARQEIFLIAVIMFLFALSIQAFERNQLWLHFLVGLGLGVATDIHQNAILFFLGFWSLYLSAYKLQVFRRRESWLWIAGVLVGVLYYLIVHVLPNPSAYFFYVDIATDHSYTPPILSMNVWTLFQSVRGELARLRLYENSLEFALLAASVVFVALRRQKYDWAYLGFLFSTFVSFALIQSSKVYFYDILIYPFYLFLVAELLASLIFDAEAKRLQRVFAACLALAFVVNGTRHVVRTANENRNYDYYAITDQIRSVLRPNDRILAVPTWWLGLTDYDFKSSYMLSHFYYFNHLSLDEGLNRISPTILIVDQAFWTLFDNPETAPERLRTLPVDDAKAFLDCCTEELLLIDSPQHGNLIIYRVINTDWTR